MCNSSAPVRFGRRMYPLLDIGGMNSPSICSLGTTATDSSSDHEYTDSHASPSSKPDEMRELLLNGMKIIRHLLVKYPIGHELIG